MYDTIYETKERNKSKNNQPILSISILMYVIINV